MNILAIDTSSKSACVGLYKNNELKADVVINHGKNHSVYIMPMIKQVLDTLETDLSEIDYFACTVGPGSFTGVRIGTTIVKTFAQIYDKKCVGVDSLFALNKSQSDFCGIVMAIEDARRDRVYARGVLNGEVIIKTQVIEVEELLNTLKTYNNRVIFVGSGALRYKEQIDKSGLDAIVKENSLIRGFDVIRCAIDKIESNEVLDAYSLVPNYLLKSQAEREKDAANRNK